jgi:hypothetical protein
MSCLVTFKSKKSLIIASYCVLVVSVAYKPSHSQLGKARVISQSNTDSKFVWELSSLSSHGVGPQLGEGVGEGLGEGFIQSIPPLLKAYAGKTNIVNEATMNIVVCFSLISSSYGLM